MFFTDLGDELISGLDTRDRCISRDLPAELVEQLE